MYDSILLFYSLPAYTLKTYKQFILFKGTPTIRKKKER